MIKMKINRQSMTAFQRKIDVFVQTRVADASDAYVEAVSEAVSDGARHRSPVLSGWLQSSAYHTDAERGSRSSRAEAGFYATYAPYVHEMGGTNSGEPKFLQNEVDQNKRSYTLEGKVAAKEALKR